MKSLIIWVSVAVMVITCAAPVHGDGPLNKLGRGAANVLTSPLEIMKGMGDANSEKGIFAGVTTGILTGTFNFVKRALVGVYEIGTFPLPFPKDYKPILDDPEYFLEREKESESLASR